jgi:hypothetical protein
MTKAPYDKIVSCRLPDKTLNVYVIFKRKNEVLVEVADGPFIGQVFYTKESNLC